MLLLLLSAMVRTHLGCNPLLVQENVRRDSRICIPFKFYGLVWFCFFVCSFFFFFWLVSLWTLLQLRAQKVSLSCTSVIDHLERTYYMPVCSLVFGRQGEFALCLDTANTSRNPVSSKVH